MTVKQLHAKLGKILEAFPSLANEDVRTADQEEVYDLDELSVGVVNVVVATGGRSEAPNYVVLFRK